MRSNLLSSTIEYIQKCKSIEAVYVLYWGKIIEAVWFLTISSSVTLLFLEIPVCSYILKIAGHGKAFEKRPWVSYDITHLAYMTYNDWLFMISSEEKASFHYWHWFGKWYMINVQPWIYKNPWFNDSWAKIVHGVIHVIRYWMRN